MPDVADVVVVGAGVVGAATAFHLATAGARVVVVDKTGIAAGATGLSAGFVRVYQEDPALAALSAAGLADFAAWERVVGRPGTFRPIGCLYRVPPDGRAAAEATIAELAGRGVLCELVGAQDLRAHYPSAHWPDDILGVWEPGAGYADPVATTRTYLDAAVAAGAELRVPVAAQAVTVTNGRVAGVRIDRGAIAAPVVVVATGAWAVRSGLLPGPALPVRTRRIVWQRDRDLPAGVPCYVDEGTDRLYVRPDAEGGVRFGAGCDEWDVDPDAAPGAVDAELLALGRHRVAARLGAAVPPACDVLAGFDGYLPDGRPVIDAWPDVDGLFVALAFGGGGFKTAPAVGRALAARVLRGDIDPLVAPFGVARFACRPR